MKWNIIFVCGVVFVLWSWKLWQSEAHQPARLYRQVPKLRVQDMASKKPAERAWRGRWLLSPLWATGCAPSRRELPVFLRFVRRVRQQGWPVQVAWVSVDQEWGVVRSFLKKQLAWRPGLDLGVHLLLDQRMKRLKSLPTVPLTAAAYGTKKFPETYLIDPKGRLLAKWEGVVSWEQDAFLHSFAQKIGVR
ncbi:MAG: TlpA disulfide reductase family protein, partial [Myxococcota bacterium]